MSVSDMSVIITGAGRGLGRALFTQLHAFGARIFAMSRTFHDFPAPEAGKLILRRVDLAHPEHIPDAKELGLFLQGASGDVVLIHNAATVEPIGPVGSLDPGEIEASLRINLLAPILITNALLAVATQHDLGVRILFISSGAAARPIDGWSLYCATKAGGELFFNTVAVQLATDPRHSVITINPGVMDTDMQKTIRDADFPDRQRYISLQEQGALAKPADVARRIIEEYL